ncbi:hypothetical protein [Halosimplex salinum]|uniref:hypothetical protein n=1 Tax=Halosimplex salinum TaxID=1710538 RepID=UPI0019D0B922|nr:hypothetical protein [Halosimplex salinum]
MTQSDDETAVKQLVRQHWNGRAATFGDEPQHGIRDGAYQASAIVESVTRTAERARTAITAIDDSENWRLATRIARPALATFDYIPNRIERGYADTPRVQGELARVELYARAVPAATAFVVERLE